QLDDVRMAQAPRDVDLAAEPQSRGLVDRDLREQHLEGDLAAVRVPAGSIDGALAAAGQLVADLVARDPGGAGSGLERELHRRKRVRARRAPALGAEQ